MLIVMVGVMTFQVSAVVVKHNNIRYNVNEDTGTASVQSTQISGDIGENLVIPDYIEYKGKHYNVTEIEEYAFRWWYKGTLTLGKNIISIGNYAFEGSSELYGPLIIPNSVKSIGNGAFRKCAGFTVLELPPTIEKIGDSAFAGCTGFTGTLNLPETLTEISAGCFSGCTGYETLNIHNSIVNIGDFAFSGCTGLKGTLVIPNSVQNIGYGAFKGCDNLKSLSLGNSILHIDISAFEGCVLLSGSLVIPNSVISIGDMAFKDCRGFRNNLIIGNSVKEIGKEAFDGCTRFTGPLVLPNSLEEIGARAFRDCSGFSGSLVIPNSVTSIKTDTFRSCRGFTDSLTIGNSVTTIDLMAFRDTNFDYIILPESLKQIGEGAFDKTYLALYGIRGIECGAIIPPECAKGFYDIFSSKDYNAPLYVPAQSVEAYKAADVWKNFFEIRAIGEILPERVVLDRENAQIKINDTLQLVATIIPENATDKTVTWSSDNEGIATVGADGTVTGVSVGIANIIATCSEATATCKVTVNPVSALGITLNVADMALLIGQSDKLTATIEPENTTDKTVTWSSDNEGIATVGADGTVTGVSVGIANITATCGEAMATCKVTVNPVSALGITLNVADMALFVGQSDKLTATIEPENTTDKTVTWSSDNEGIATVGADGTVTAVSVGIANITATCGEATTTCKITVNPIEASSIELSLLNVTMLLGSKITLTAKVYPENTTNQIVSWSSSDPAIASIDADGIITALQVGETTVMGTCGSVSSICKVTVTPVSPSSIELNIKDMILFLGQSETIQAIVRPANTTNPTVTWQSEDETVATVSENGKVTGIKEGVTTVTATCGDVSTACIVTVNPIPASNINITTGDVTLTMGSSTDLAAKVSPENTTHPEVEWSSSDNNIVTISAEGTVTAINIGTAIITAKCGNVSDTCTVTVIPVSSEGIIISPSTVSILLGDDITLTASVFPESTTDKKVTWGSENPSIASVSSAGVVTALKVGTTTITASNGTAKASCIVTVKPVEATSISLNVKDETIFVASSTQLVANVSPTNVTDKTIIWTSSKPEIATVSDEGLVTGLSVGSTTVTATIGAVAATCQINVVHRIPDMDPSVTTSERDLFTISGQTFNMAIYAEGGERTGWSYLWTKNGETVSTGSGLNIVAINNSKTVITDTYRVKVENEIDKVVIFSESYDFVVHIYPSIEQPTIDDDITISTGNDSSNKIREGNTVTLTATPPKGGNPQGWDCVWSNSTGNIGEGESIETVATMSSGISMSIENSSYYLEMTNYSPEGTVWAQFKLEANLDVYRRPLTPLQFVRKGNGASHTLIAMMSIPDSQLEQLNYTFVYGWTDTNGTDCIINRTPLRYCHTDAEVYNNSTNKFWVYTIWTYQDGSVVSSGRRYLDGDVDEDFDASTFGGNASGSQSGHKSRPAIYTIDGHYIGSDTTLLSPGLYIITYETDGVNRTEKIIIR